VGHLTEPVYYHEDDRVAIRWGETHDKVQGDVGPGAMRHVERLKKTSRGLMRKLVPIAGGAGIHKLPGVLLQGVPPEPLQNDIAGPLDPRMAGQLGGLGPQNNVRNEQAIRRAGAGAGLVLSGGSYFLLDLPGEGGDPARSWEEGLGPCSRNWRDRTLGLWLHNRGW